jgi:glutathione S-transferase
MKLYTFPSSPFGAKVLAVAHACNLQKNLTLKEIHPWQVDSELRVLNPLNKIPVLETKNGAVIFDSKVICEYLLETSNNQHLFGKDRIQSLKIQALADGALDAAVLMRYEKFFKPQYLQSEDWYERQHLAVVSAIEYFNSNVDDLLSDALLFSNLCVAITIAYFELRFSSEPWRKNYLTLYKWYDDYCLKHEFLSECKPKDWPIPDSVECIKK